MPIKIPGYKVKFLPDGRKVVEKDVAAQEAKLDVSTRLQRRNSKRVRVARKGA